MSGSVADFVQVMLTIDITGMFPGYVACLGKENFSDVQIF